MRLELTFTDPLDQDDDGTIRLRGSRVTLDTLVGVFKRGDSPEEIQEGFPSLTLFQIHGAIAWYLNNQVAADQYLNQRTTEADTTRHQIEDQPEYTTFRELMRRRREQ